MQIHFGSHDFPLIGLFPKKCNKMKTAIVRDDFFPIFLFIFIFTTEDKGQRLIALNFVVKFNEHF